MINYKDKQPKVCSASLADIWVTNANCRFPTFVYHKFHLHNLNKNKLAHNNTALTHTTVTLWSLEHTSGVVHSITITNIITFT